MNILDGDTGGLVERLDVDAAAIALKEVYPDIASAFAKGFGGQVAHPGYARYSTWRVTGFSRREKSSPCARSGGSMQV